jgi:L-ribulokinase
VRRHGERNELLLDIYASVLNRPLRRAQSLEVCARGAAILGATRRPSPPRIAARFERVVTHHGPPGERQQRARRERCCRLQELYALYEVLHDQFGLGDERVMEKLRAIRART